MFLCLDMCEDVYTIGLCGNAPLSISGQTLTEPHLFPCSIGDRIAKPAVSNLMDDINQQKLLTLQYRGNYESKTGILHGNDGEGRRKEHYVVPVKGETG